MANRAAAMRYARALFNVCEQEGELERVARELAEFTSVMDEHQLLRKSLLSPGVPPGAKRVLMETLLGRSEGYSEITVRLLNLLAERDRLLLLGEILEVYGERLMEHDGVVRARITTAAPLPTGREQAITEQLGTATGKKVIVETDVDPSVIGGVVTQIGSTVWDGSISSHLERLRQRFLGKA